MNEYEAATLAVRHPALWVAATGLAVKLGLTILVLLEIRKFARWSEQLARERWIYPSLVDTFKLCAGGVRCQKNSSAVRAGVPAPVRQAGFAVELVRTGRTPGELAREFECSAQAIRNWVRQADRDEGRREDGLTIGEREELRRLRRENRQLREEREILKKAAAWFARETGTIPGRSSSS